MSSGVHKSWYTIFYTGVSENSVPLNPLVNDHYPYEKWLFHCEYTIFSDKPIPHSFFFRQKRRPNGDGTSRHRAALLGSPRPGNSFGSALPSGRYPVGPAPRAAGSTQKGAEREQ